MYACTVCLWFAYVCVSVCVCIQREITKCNPFHNTNNDTSRINNFYFYFFMKIVLLFIIFLFTYTRSNKNKYFMLCACRIMPWKTWCYLDGSISIMYTV